MSERSDYPQGDGIPNCPFCRGRGVVPLTKEERPPMAIGEVTKICNCVLIRDVMHNLERGWKGLSKAKPIESSPLAGKHTEDLIITSSAFKLKQHVKHIAARMGPRWNFLVVSDATLMDAWLSKGLDIYDADILGLRENDRRKLDKSPIEALSELVEHPALLIICLGVKAARNSAMPEVLLETLTLRAFRDKTTWLVDQPAYPLMEGHISYSSFVGSHIESWGSVALDSGIQKMDMGTNVPGEKVPVPTAARPTATRPTATRPAVRKSPVSQPPVQQVVEESSDNDWADDELRKVEQNARNKKWKKGGKR